MSQFSDRIPLPPVDAAVASLRTAAAKHVGMTRNSTRRLCCRPSSVPLSSIGKAAPKPWGTSRAWSTPKPSSWRHTAFARAREILTFSAALPWSSL